MKNVLLYGYGKQAKTYLSEKCFFDWIEEREPFCVLGIVDRDKDKEGDTAIIGGNEYRVKLYDSNEIDADAVLICPYDADGSIREQFVSKHIEILALNDYLEQYHRWLYSEDYECYGLHLQDQRQRQA